MRSRRIGLAVLCLGAALTVLLGSDGGCDTGVATLAGDKGAGESMFAARDAGGPLKILITDKPFPFEFIEQALITITRLEVRRAGGEGEPFLTVFEQDEGKSFNLMDLQNGRVDVLAEAHLPAGEYTQVRVTVTQGEVRLRDGRVFVLRSPGGEEAGVRLEWDFQVRADSETVLLLDVDLSRAFSPVPGGAVVEPDQIREFRFSPSAGMRLVRLEQAGSLSGTVRDVNGYPIPFVAVTALAGGVEVSSTATDEHGTFTIIGLTAGECAVEFSADGYVEKRLDGVSISGGATADAGNVVLEPAARKAALASLAAGSAAGQEDVNYALHGQVTLHGAFFSTIYHSGPWSDPQTLTDGIFLPRRTTWDQGTVWWTWVYYFNAGQYIELDLGQACRIESVVVQTNSTETYVLSYWDLDQQDWRTAWDVPRGDAGAFGMETRPDPRDNTVRYVLPSSVVTNRLKLAGAATTGVHLYSVSEIQAFGKPLNSPPVADAGGPYVAAATSWDGATVKLDGSGSTDPDGDALQYSWRIGDQEIGTTPDLARVFPVGETPVSLVVADSAGATDMAQAEVTVTVIEVGVDVRPGDAENNVHLGSNGVLPVAFLTDGTFDAASINPATISFPGHEFSGFVRMAGNDGRTPQASLTDADGDGDLDLVVNLEVAALPLGGSETTCTLGALTWDGDVVRGSDRIRFVGSSAASSSAGVGYRNGPK